MNFTEQTGNQFTKTGGATNPWRQVAFTEFQRLGLPNRKNEAWKYTALTALDQREWSAPPVDAVVPELVREIMRTKKAEFDIALVLDGHLVLNESILTLESGYEFTKIATSGPLPLKHDDGVISAAVAAMQGGFELRVAPGLKFTRPLLIVHCQTGDGTWASTLNRMVVGAGAQMQVAEIFVGSAQQYLRTDVTHVELKEGSRLDWVRCQEEGSDATYFSEVQCQMETKAQLFLTQTNAGAEWARSSLKIDIRGELAEAHVNGLSFGRGEQHVDQRVQISHWAANTQSSQLFKGILKDRSRGVLNGKIYIARHAQKVNSSQLNHNLLLSPTAEADTKPELEIYADDVKANHGATVGRLDDDKLFYLLSRAIPRAEAEQMLAQAFLRDVVMKVESLELRSLLNERVNLQLPNFSSEQGLAT